MTDSAEPHDTSLPPDAPASIPAVDSSGLGERLALAAVLLVAAGLRFWNLGGPSLWADEGLTVRLVRLPFGQMLAEVRNWEQTPPALHLLLWAWGRAFGWSEASLRFPSALLGVLAVYLAWRAGREWFAPAAGLVAATVLALNPFHLCYSREARAYSLMVTAGLASCLCFVRCLRGAGARAQAAFVLTTALLLYAHLYGGFVAAAEFAVFWGAWAIGLARRRGAPPLSVRRYLTLCAAVAVLYAPWVNVVLFEWTWVVTSGMFWIQEKGPGQIATALAQYWNGRWPAAVGVALAAYGCWRWRRSEGAWLAAALVPFSVVVPVLISMAWTPVFWPRYGLMALVGMTLLIGAATAPPRPRAKPAAAALVFPPLVIAAAATLLGFHLAHPPARADWRSVGRDLAQQVRPGEFVMPVPGYQAMALAYYLDRPDVRIEWGGKYLPEDLPAQTVWVPLNPEAAQFGTDEFTRSNPAWDVQVAHQYEGLTLLRLTRR